MDDRAHIKLFLQYLTSLLDAGVDQDQVLSQAYQMLDLKYGTQPSFRQDGPQKDTEVEPPTKEDFVEIIANSTHDNEPKLAKVRKTTIE